MDESEENMSAEDIITADSPLSVKNKPKKKSLVERELETSLTARVTSPVTGEGTNTSRYGRARRLKIKTDMDDEKVMKPLRIDTSKSPSQAYKMHASNSPIRKESPKQVAGSIEDQIENIYNENISLSRFGSEEHAKTQSPAKKFSKIYIRKDLIQKPDADTVTLIKNMFSPVNKTNTHLNNILERSSEKYLLNGHGVPRNGFPDTSSVVKTLDFDNKKKKNDVKDKTVCKNDLFELEAVCEYQVGDLAWARVGTYPFWPCIVTREPFTDMFVKKKLFGRVEHNVIHVTFFGDNGRRGWIVDNMLRKFHGRAEFESAREKFTPEAKKKDPRFYAAHFVSDKKLTLWNISVAEAESFMREPKRFRIDILHDMLEKTRITKATPKREKGGKITRTGSDVSLSESLYDTLFSEDDGKVDESSNTKKPRNKSLDVSEVVTACLDNMAAKSGIIQIQRQSHMDRWLQKAKSKTPEKTQPKLQIKTERERRKERTKKKKETRKPKLGKNESLSSKTNLMPYQNEHDYSSVNYENHDINHESSNINTDFEESGYDDTVNSSSLEVAVKVESISSGMEDCSQDDIITTVVNDDIVMTDAENISKVVNDENANDSKKIINDSVHDINATRLENSINSNESEQNETKLELKLKNKELSNEGIQTRRSKRKRQSGEDKNNSPVESNPVKKPLLDLVDSKTELNTIATNSNIECNNIDDQGHLSNKIINDGQLCPEDYKNEIKEEPLIDGEVNKDTPKQSKLRKNEINKETPIEREVNKDAPKQCKPRKNEINKETPIEREDNKATPKPSKLRKDEIKEETPIERKVNKDTPKQSKLRKNEISEETPIEREVNKDTPKLKKNEINKETPIEREVNKDTPKQAKLRKNEVKEELPIEREVNKDTPKQSKLRKNEISEETPIEKEVNKDTPKQSKLKKNEIKDKLPIESEVNKDTPKQSKLRKNEIKEELPIEREFNKDTPEQSKLRKNEISEVTPLEKEVNKDTPKQFKLSKNEIKEEAPIERELSKDTPKQSKMRKNEIKEETPIEREVNKDAPKQSKLRKQRFRSELLPLNAPNPVVLIEALKLNVLEITSLVKANPNVHGKVLKSKHRKKDNIKANTKKNKTTIMVNKQQVNSKPLHSINKEEDTTKENTEKPEDDIIVKEKSSIQNASYKTSEVTDTIPVTDEVKNNLNDNADTPEDVALGALNTDNEIGKDQETTNNEEVSKENHSSTSNENVSDRMDVDDREIINMNRDVQSDNLKPDIIVSKDTDFVGPLKTRTTDTMEPLETNEINLPLGQENTVLIKPDTANIVIGEETYTFDRTMSQDYDEIDTDKVDDVNNLPIDSSNKEVNNKGCDLLGNTDVIFDQTASQDYDEIIKATVVDKYSSDTDVKPEASLSTQEANNKVGNLFVSNDFEKTLSQDCDKVNKEVVVVATEKSDINATSEDNSLTEEVNNENKSCNSPMNNDLKFERTLSPDYDEVNKIVDVENSKLDAKLEDSLCTKEDISKSSKKKNTDVNCDIVECHSVNVVDKVSGYNSKEESQTSVQDVNTPSLSIEVSPMLTHNDNIHLFLKTVKKSVDQVLEENNTKPEIKTVTSNEELNEQIAKIQKSPKLSLNRTKKQTMNKTSTINLPKDTSESHYNILLDVFEKDNVAPSNDLKNDGIQSNSDVKHTDLIKLIEMKDPKASDLKINGLVQNKERSPDRKFKEELDSETASIKSEDSAVSTSRRKIRSKEKQDVKKAMDDPEFVKYAELYQDALIDEQPELTQDEIITYLYQTWLYEESNKSERKKTDDAEQSKLVKGLNQEPAPQPRKYKKKPKVEKEPNIDIRDIMPKEKPKRKIAQSKPYYNEDFSDLEEDSDLETFNIFDSDVNAQNEDGEQIDEVELYFEKLTKPKPNVFKGFIREKVCEICELTGNLVKCKGCHAMFHVDCVMKGEETMEVPAAPTRGRKKKKKKETRGRKPKGYEESLMDSGSQSDERSQDANISEEFNISVEDEPESLLTVDAENFEAQWAIKMKELTPENVDNVEDFESDQEVQWDAPPGQCEIVDVRPKEKPIDYTDFKCYNCLKYDTPVCFVCKSDKSPKGLIEVRQKCQVAHCHRYYHLECLEYWPQTQFNSWEPSKTNKKVMDYIEALFCPRHVCHTCVSDDPRGCKTRFCSDKLARCVKCPATYHSFTKCLPAGTQILTGSQIICPRHYEQRSGKVPCHVNTGWCFICALGGTLICCEYCPTSFHAECLNIKPPEGSYMCEDCETGRLPLYGEMVWVKLGHYRWWPGIVLHPCEIPDNIMAVKHSPGEFVVRFFGQYDHYWVNRGRVFPFQEGDSGKISSQKSKIDAAFTTAMEHAQRACEILKNVEPNEEEEEDIASSLLPPHYVKLKVNKPVGSLTARRDDDANSLTQCDCDPTQPDPCGPYSHCLNRMLLTECGPLCRAGERCNNRAFERRAYPRLAAARAPTRGWGLRALEDIKQGQFVIEYVGELIDEEEFRRRMRRKHEVRDENFYFLTLDKERMIDAGPKGNLARFMNHCCEPNCETQKWTVLGDVRVGLFALRDIPANSEVTFNYNLECAGIEKKRCLCGAKRCSGYIGAKPKQEEVQPKKMKVPAKRAYKKRQKVEDSPSTSKTKPIKVKITKPIKPRELTEIEKDLLIIKNATNGMSSDSEGSRLSSVDEKKDTKALKRKRVSFSTEEVVSNSSAKKVKLDECKSSE